MLDEPGPSLIWDRQQPDRLLAGRAIYLRPKTHLPYKPDVIVTEQDSWLVLGEQTVLRDDNRPAWVQANQLEDTPGYAPGTVMSRPGIPARLVAIVYDLEQQPLCRPEWVETALFAILQYCHVHDLAHLQIPLLGFRHGGIGLEQFVIVLESVLLQYSETNPTTVMIALPDEVLRRQLLKLLKQDSE